MSTRRRPRDRGARLNWLSMDPAHDENALAFPPLTALECTREQCEGTVDVLCIQPSFAPVSLREEAIAAAEASKDKRHLHEKEAELRRREETYKKSRDQINRSFKWKLGAKGGLMRQSSMDLGKVVADRDREAREEQERRAVESFKLRQEQEELDCARKAEVETSLERERRLAEEKENLEILIARMSAFRQVQRWSRQLTDGMRRLALRNQLERAMTALDEAGKTNPKMPKVINDFRRNVRLSEAEKQVGRLQVELDMASEKLKKAEEKKNKFKKQADELKEKEKTLRADIRTELTIEFNEKMKETRAENVSLMEKVRELERTKR